ncbi:MAG: hypothetical protein V1721_03970 [Pseudomonadota bacterium]
MRNGFSILFIAAALGGCAREEERPAQSMVPAPVIEGEDRNLPALVVTRESSPDIIHRETLVTRKADEMSREVDQLRIASSDAGDRLLQLQVKNDAGASEYYFLMASISTELQSGSTPGNPNLQDQWIIAQDKLNALAQSAGLLNALATDLSGLASRASYLLEATQAAFSISGAVKEDHKKLTAVSDKATQNIALINRLLTRVNDEIVRRTTYLRTERANLQTLSLGIANGELYGQSMANSLFRKAMEDGKFLSRHGDPSSFSGTPPAASLSSRRPLVIIHFDRPNVNYDQPMYAAINQALEKYPAARFDLVAVSNMEGNPAQMALSSIEARKNGEAVLRSLVQMGLPLERIRLSAAGSKDVINSEVHIYLQ